MSEQQKNQGDYGQTASTTTGPWFPGVEIIPGNPKDKLFAALAKAQAAFQPITRNRRVVVTMRSGGKYDFYYATLDNIIGSVVPHLSAHGISVIQPVSVKANQITVDTILAHESGQSIQSSLSWPSNGDIQEAGKTITYLRRYSLSSMLNICAEEDTDGPERSNEEKQPMDRPGPKYDAGLNGAVTSIQAKWGVANKADLEGLDQPARIEKFNAWATGLFGESKDWIQARSWSIEMCAKAAEALKSDPPVEKKTNKAKESA